MGEKDDTERRRGATILRTEFGTYMLGGSRWAISQFSIMSYCRRADGKLAESVLKWDPGEKRWQQEKGKSSNLQIWLDPTCDVVQQGLWRREESARQ